MLPKSKILNLAYTPILAIFIVSEDTSVYCLYLTLIRKFRGVINIYKFKNVINVFILHLLFSNKLILKSE